MMYKERYGGSIPTFGTGYWFYPQVFRYLDERGLSRSDIFSVLGENVMSMDAVRTVLTETFPEKRTIIDQVFERYVN
jgi:hypothetical protein